VIYRSISLIIAVHRRGNVIIFIGIIGVFDGSWILVCLTEVIMI